MSNNNHRKCDDDDDDYFNELCNLVKSIDDRSISYMVSKSIFCSEDVYISADDLEVNKSRGIFRSKRKDIYNSVVSVSDSNNNENNHLFGSLESISGSDNMKKPLEISYSFDNSCAMKNPFVFSNNQPDTETEEVFEDDDEIMKDNINTSVNNVIETIEKQSQQTLEPPNISNIHQPIEYKQSNSIQASPPMSQPIECQQQLSIPREEENEEEKQHQPIDEGKSQQLEQQQLFDLRRSSNSNQTQSLFSNSIDQLSSVMYGSSVILNLPMPIEELPPLPLPLPLEIHVRKEQEGTTQQENSNIKRTEERLPDIPLPMNPDDFNLSDYNLKEEDGFSKDDICEYIIQSTIKVTCSGCNKVIKKIHSFGKRDGSFYVCIPCSLTLNFEKKNAGEYDWEESIKDDKDDPTPPCDGFRRCKRMAHFKPLWSFLERNKLKGKKQGKVQRNEFALKIETQCLYCRNFKKRQHMNKKVKDGLETPEQATQEYYDEIDDIYSNKEACV